MLSRRTRVISKTSTHGQGSVRPNLDLPRHPLETLKSPCGRFDVLTFRLAELDSELSSLSRGGDVHLVAILRYRSPRYLDPVSLERGCNLIVVQW